MFSTPINDLTFRNIEEFCRALPREGITIDYKVDFPRRLDKVLASFANTFGGHILIGVDETTVGEPVLPLVGIPLQPGLRERVVAIALDAITPPVFPEVRVIEFQSPGASVPDRAVIIIRVHESDASAHSVDGGNSVYLRVDNISDQFTRQATTEEIEWLLNKRKKSIDLKERILREARGRASNYLPIYRTTRRLGTDEPRGKFTLWTVPTFPRSELASPQRLLELSRTWRVRVANFDFPAGNANPIADGVRHPQTPVGNFWYTEVSRFGLVYSEIGFTGRGDEFRDAIVCSLIASLMVANLRFSLNLYETLGYLGLIDFRFEIAPTLNRYPFVPDALGGNHMTHNRGLENSINLALTASVKEFRESLLESARQKYREFLWAFGWDLNDAAASGHFNRFDIT